MFPLAWSLTLAVLLGKSRMEDTLDFPFCAVQIDKAIFDGEEHV